MGVQKENELIKNKIPNKIQVRNARVHNLKNIDVTF